MMESYIFTSPEFAMKTPNEQQNYLYFMENLFKNEVHRLLNEEHKNRLGGDYKGEFDSDEKTGIKIKKSTIDINNPLKN